MYGMEDSERREGLQREAPIPEADPRGQLFNLVRNLALQAFDLQAERDSKNQGSPFHPELPTFWTKDRGRLKVYIEGPVPDEELSPLTSKNDDQVTSFARRQAYWLVFDVGSDDRIREQLLNAEEATIHIRTPGEDRAKFITRPEILGPRVPDKDEDFTQSAMLELAQLEESEQKIQAEAMCANLLKCKPGEIDLIPDENGNSDTTGNSGLEGNNVA